MPVFLSRRQPDLVEQMDKKDCDPVKLNNTYNQFSVINGMLSNWKRIYRNQIRPILSITPEKECSLLDIGFGGGDIPISISKWATQDGYHLKITAIETDDRAFEFAKSLPESSSVAFLNCSSTDLVKQQQKFDIVISNHVLHHLDEQNTLQILDEAKKPGNFSCYLQ